MNERDILSEIELLLSGNSISGARGSEQKRNFIRKFEIEKKKFLSQYPFPFAVGYLYFDIPTPFSFLYNKKYSLFKDDFIVDGQSNYYEYCLGFINGFSDDIQHAIDFFYLRDHEGYSKDLIIEAYRTTLSRLEANKDTYSKIPYNENKINEVEALVSKFSHSFEEHMWLIADYMDWFIDIVDNAYRAVDTFDNVISVLGNVSTEEIRKIKILDTFVGYSQDTDTKYSKFCTDNNAIMSSVIQQYDSTGNNIIMDETKFSKKPYKQLDFKVAVGNDAQSIFNIPMEELPDDCAVAICQRVAITIAIGTNSHFKANSLKKTHKQDVSRLTKKYSQWRPSDLQTGFHIHNNTYQQQQGKWG